MATRHKTSSTVASISCCYYRHCRTVSGNVLASQAFFFDTVCAFIFIYLFLSYTPHDAVSNRWCFPLPDSETDPMIPNSSCFVAFRKFYIRIIDSGIYDLQPLLPVIQRKVVFCTALIQDSRIPSAACTNSRFVFLHFNFRISDKMSILDSVIRMTASSF